MSRIEPTIDLSDLDGFCLHVASMAGQESAVDETALLVEDLGFTGPSISLLVMSLQLVNPHFHLPLQMDVHDITVLDVFYFLSEMDAQYLEEVER